MTNSSLLTLTCLLLAGCISDSIATPDAAEAVDATLATPDAAITSDANFAECDVFAQNCTAPLACLWTGDATGGVCRMLGGLQGVGDTSAGETCDAHALCEPGLGCFNTNEPSDASVLMGACWVLCVSSDPAQCTASEQCTPIPDIDGVGYCL